MDETHLAEGLMHAGTRHSESETEWKGSEGWPSPRPPGPTHTTITETPGTLHRVKTSLSAREASQAISWLTNMVLYPKVLQQCLRKVPPIHGGVGRVGQTDEG